MTDTVRKDKTADQLKPGDWIAPGEMLDDAAEVLYAFTYRANADRSRDNGGQHVQLVVRGQGETVPYTDVVAGNWLVSLASEEDLAELKQAAERAKAIADLRAFADFLDRNSWAPLPRMDAQVHLDERHLGGPDAVSAYATVRELADRLGAKPEERLDDRTVIRKGFGRVEYSVIAWHPDGRPAEPDDPETPGQSAAIVDANLRAMGSEGLADPTGLSYTRADDGPDDPTPVSGGRVEPHNGAMTDGGLVDETAPHPSWPTEQELKPWESLAPAADRVAESMVPIGPIDETEAGSLCNGAPAGFQADCGRRGEHGPHAIGAR